METEPGGHTVSDRRAVMTLVALVAMLPVLRMTLLVRRGTEVQHFDYWYVLDRVLTDGGGIDLRGLVTIHNIHPLVLSGLAYWAVARFGGGSNIVLGYGVVLVGVIQVGLIAWWGHRTVEGRARLAVLVLAASFLVVSPAGAWNFLESMSGTAWLPANVFVLLAVWFHLQRRTGLTIGLGLLASISYGTGLLVWPVLVLIALMRPGEPRLDWRATLPYAAAGCVCAGLYLLAPVSGTEFLPKNTSTGLAWDTPRTVLTVAGFILAGNPWLAAVLGGVACLGGAVLSIRIVRVGGLTVIWPAMWLYSLASITLMALGRTEAFNVFGTTQFSRYASLAALLWVSVVAMALATFDGIWPIAVAVACAAIATTVAGQKYVDQQEHKRLAQEELAVALRVGVADGSRVLFFTRFPDLTERLRRIHHFPFDRDFMLDCGKLGTTITTEIRPLPRTRGALTSVGPAALAADAVSLRGWVDTPQPVRCVVVVDAHGKVVGTGLGNAPTPERVLHAGSTMDPTAGLIALVPRGAAPYRVLVGSSPAGPLSEVLPSR